MSDKVLLAGAVAAALATSALGAEVEFARITNLQTVGGWQDAGLYGEIRLISVSEGFDHLTHSLYVDWVWLDADSASSSVLQTRRVPDCANGAIARGVLPVAQSSGDMERATEILLQGDDDTLILVIGAPGQVELLGCK